MLLVITKNIKMQYEMLLVIIEILNINAIHNYLMYEKVCILKMHLIIAHIYHVDCYSVRCEFNCVKMCHNGYFMYPINLNSCCNYTLR